MATFGQVQYDVVTGTVAALAAFNTAVEAKVNLGFAPVGPPTCDGTNINQVFMTGGASSFTAQYTINQAVVGAAGLGTIRILGTVANQFPLGFRFSVVGSTGNNGIYTVLTVVEGGGNTTITPREAVPSAVADGSVLQYA